MTVMERKWRDACLAAQAALETIATELEVEVDFDDLDATVDKMREVLDEWLENRATIAAQKSRIEELEKQLGGK